jgi:hypothetical protein
VENATSPSKTMWKMMWSISQGGFSYMQTVTMIKYLEKYTFKFLDVQVFILDVEKDDIFTFLHVIAQAPVRSSVIWIKSFWTDLEEADFRNALKDLKLRCPTS